MKEAQKNRPRKGWFESFKEMHEEKADELLISDVFEDESYFDDSENNWEDDENSDQSKKHT